MKERTAGPMPATPGSFLDTMQSQAYGVASCSMWTRFGGIKDITEVSDFYFTGVTPIYRAGPRPFGRVTQSLGACSSIAPTGLYEIPEVSEPPISFPEPQGGKKRVSIISSILPPPPFQLLKDKLNLL